MSKEIFKKIANTIREYAYSDNFFISPENDEEYFINNAIKALMIEKVENEILPDDYDEVIIFEDDYEEDFIKKIYPDEIFDDHEKYFLSNHFFEIAFEYYSKYFHKRFENATDEYLIPSDQEYFSYHEVRDLFMNFRLFHEDIERLFRETDEIFERIINAIEEEDLIDKRNMN